MAKEITVRFTLFRYKALKSVLLQLNKLDIDRKEGYS